MAGSTILEDECKLFASPRCRETLTYAKITVIKEEEVWIQPHIHVVDNLDTIHGFIVHNNVDEPAAVEILIGLENRIAMLEKLDIITNLALELV